MKKKNKKNNKTFTKTKIYLAVTMVLMGSSALNFAEAWTGADTVPNNIDDEIFSNSGSFTIDSDITANLGSAIAGGWANGTTAVQNKSVTNNASINGKSALDFYGGLSENTTGNTTASSNTFTNSPSGSLTNIQMIYGGKANSGSTGNATANSNTVNLNGTVSSVTSVFGGEAQAQQGDATANSNVVNISAGTYSGDIYGGNAVSESGNSTASNNKVNISGGTYKGEVFGGNAAPTSNGNISKDYIADNNEIHISGNVSFSKIIYGGNVTSNSGQLSAAKASANNNKIYLDGEGTFTQTIYGGYVKSNHQDTEATANNNTIYIKKGTYTNEITAGSASSSGPSYANNNRIYVSGTANLQEATLNGGTAGQPKTGNILYFGDETTKTPWTPTNYTIKQVTNFNKIVFIAAKWGETITINTIGASLKPEIDATNVAFTADTPPAAGASYDMLKVTTFSSSSNPGLALSGTTATTAQSNYTVGTTVSGTGTVSLEDQDGDGKYHTVKYTIATTGGGGSSSGGDGSSGSSGSSSSSSNTPSSSEPASGGMPELTAQPQTHGVAMATAVATTVLTQGSETSAMALHNLSISCINGVQTFIAMGGGAARVKTGSHVNVKSLNFSVGVGTNTQTDYSLLTYGAAFEAGFGRYKNSYDAGAADPYVNKKGHVSYCGGALIGNYTFNNLYHLDGIFRIGRARTQQNNALYDASTGIAHSFKLSYMYTGLELGGGKIFKLDDKSSIDLYSKYFYLHQGSDDFYAGGNYHIHSISSHILKLAGRYQYDLSKRTSVYAGLGGAYEFDGKAKVTLDYDVKATPAECDGFRGFAEVGMKLKPEGDTGFFFNFDVKGHYGSKYRDVMATAEARYLF